MVIQWLCGISCRPVRETFNAHPSPQTCYWGGKKGTPIDWNGGGKMQRRAGWVGGVIGYLWVSKGPGLGSREALVLFNNGDASVVKGILGRSAFKRGMQRGRWTNAGLSVLPTCSHRAQSAHLPILHCSLHYHHSVLFPFLICLSLVGESRFCWNSAGHNFTESTPERHMAWLFLPEKFNLRHFILTETGLQLSRNHLHDFVSGSYFLVLF